MGAANSRNQIGYVIDESVWGTSPNTAGASNIANADAFLFQSLTTKLNQPTIASPDKTPVLSSVIGIPGRKISEWAMRCGLRLSGAAGTAPDIDSFLKAAFGQAGVVSAGVSVTYSLADASPSMSIFNYYDPASIIQELILGAIVQNVRVEWGGDVPMIELSGQGITNDSGRFATSDATEKGGLTSFPTRPAAPVTNGTPQPGFLGTITLDGVAYTIFRSGSLSMASGRELPQDVFNSYHPGSPAQDERDVRLDFTMDEDDGANFKALLLKSQGKTAWDAIIQIGTLAGSIFTATIKRLQFDAPERDDGSRKLGRRFTGKAHGTASLKDELTFVVT